MENKERDIVTPESLLANLRQGIADNVNEKATISSMSPKTMVETIGNDFRKIGDSFQWLIENLSPIGDRLTGNHEERYVAESELSTATDSIKDRLKRVYHLVGAVRHKFPEIQNSLGDAGFIFSFNSSIQKTSSVLNENNNDVRSLSQDTNSAPKWFNEPQIKEDSLSHSPHLTLQIIYNECYNAAMLFFKIVEELRVKEPKINAPTKVPNLITSAETLNFLNKESKKSAELRKVKIEATDALKKLYPGETIL